MTQNQTTESFTPVWWEIRSPADHSWIRRETWKEIMRYWEGYNVPFLVVDGVREEFEKAYARMKRYYNPETGEMVK